MITSEFPPHAAGIGYASYHLAKALIYRGHCVTIITRGSWMRTKIRTFEGIKIYELPFIPFFPPFHILYHGLFVNRLLKQLQNDIDIIHLHSPLVPLITVNLPIITTVHSTWYYEAKSFTQITDWYSLAVQLFKRPFIKYEKMLFSKSIAFIAISGAIRGELIKHYQINPGEINIIRNSIDTKNYKSVGRKNQKNNKEFTILTICRLVYRKGILDLIEAAKILCRDNPDIIFNIIGEGPLKKTLQKKIKEYHLENNIILKGMIPNNLIKNYIQAASVFVIPSYYEGLPIVLLEALASGKPVVGTNIAGINEIIEDGKNGLLVQKNNPVMLAKTILTLFKDNTLRSLLIKNARETAKQFDRSVMVDDTLNLYQNILSLKKLYRRKK